MPIEGRDEWLSRDRAAGMRDGYLRGALSPQATQRQIDVRI
jgi:hypothetical protein